ncbi:MAG: Ig-like domain-containing protein, partial [Gemmataceae bacterium]|nr:Ig-like domain-containing protein [Gemmataceae bacterium]
MNVLAVPPGGDNTPPVVTITTGPVAGALLSGNATYKGTVTDNQSGIALLQAAVDTGGFQDVAVAANGTFRFDTQLLLGGGLDGPHDVRFRAFDKAGNPSAVVTRTFTLDSVGPQVSFGITDPQPVAVSSVPVTFTEVVSAAAFDPASFTLISSVAVQIVGVSKTSDRTAVVQLSAALPDGTYTLSITGPVMDAAGNSLAGARAITFTVSDPVGIEAISPENGEELVSLTRETVVRFDGPVDPATITPNSFYLIANGEKLAGSIRVSPTEKFATFFYANPLPDSTQVRVYVDGDKIVGRDGLNVDTDGDGVPGGVGTADFRTAPLTFIPNTIVEGRVFDSHAKAKDGSDIPVAGVRIELLGRPDIFAITDATGKFELGVQDQNGDGVPDGLPAPSSFVHIGGDSGTSAALPAGSKYANLSKPFPSIPGERMVKPMGVFLPPMADADVVPLSMTADTQVGFGPTVLNPTTMAEIFPDLTPEQRAMLDLVSVTFPAGSAQNPDGTPLTLGTVIPVNPNRLPGPLPAGLNPSLVVSIQAGSAAGFDPVGANVNFAVPAPVTFPNLDGLAPGEQGTIMSFDHDKGEWVEIGTATVSADGRSLTSDPGVGILAPGWHCVDRLARLIGGGQDSNVPCEDEVNALNMAAFDLALSVVPFDGIAESVVDVYNEVNFASSIIRDAVSGSYRDVAVTVVKRVIGDLFPPVGIVFGVLDVANALDAFLMCLVEQSITNPAAGQNAQDNVQRQRDLFDRARDYHRALTGLDHIANTATPADHRRTLSILDRLPDLVTELPDGTRVITEANCQILLALPRPSHLSAADIRAMCAHFAQLLNSLINSGIGGAFTTALERFRDVMLDALNSGWTRTDDGTGRLLSQYIGSETARLAATPVGQTFYRIQGGLSQRGRVDAFPKFAVSANTAFTFNYAQILSSSGGGGGGGNGGGILFQLSTVSVISGGPGSCVTIPRTVGSPLSADAPDMDSDGIPDVVEDIIGTSIASADTDGDGIADLAEILQDSDPLGGRQLPTGVIASLALRGEAQTVTVVGSTANPTQQTAFIATGTYGLAVVDASNFQRPTVLGQLDLDGTAVDVAVDPVTNVAVVAAGDGGLHFVDIADRMLPRLLRTARVEATQVEIADGLAYATVGGRIFTYDTGSGEVLTSFNTGDTSPITGFAREGNTLFTFDTDRTLRAFTVSGLDLVPGDTVDLPEGDGTVNVTGGVTYIGVQNAILTGGFTTVNVADPNNLFLISPSDIADPFIAPGVAIVPNGSGKALAVGLVGQQANQPVVAIVDVTDPANTANYLAEFPLSATPVSAAIASGIGYVATGTGGLQVVNYLSFDTAGMAPTLTATGPTGATVDEGSRVRVGVTVADDVQVRNVELLVDGRVVVNDVAAPFDLSAVMPTLASGASTVTLQVRATDTGGNATLSNSLTYTLTKDATPPILLASTPANNGAGFRVEAVTFRFTE